MTAKKDKKQQPGNAGAVEATEEELSEKELAGVSGGFMGTNFTFEDESFRVDDEAANRKK